MDHLQTHLEGRCACPLCGGNNVEEGNFTVVRANAERNMRCRECEKEWIDVYVLTDMRSI